MLIDLTAVSLKELSKSNSKKFNERGLNCIMHAIDYERKSDEIRYLFLVEGLESYSNKSGHIVSILFDKGSAAAPLKSRPFNDQCRVHCQCPSFVYWGAAYNSTKEGYNLDLEETRAPDVRDPKREVKLCKHLARTIRSIRNLSYRFLDKKAGFTAASIQEEFGLVPITECTSAITSYLETFKKEIDPQEFLSNLDRSNFEENLLSIGAII